MSWDSCSRQIGGSSCPQRMRRVIGWIEVDPHDPTFQQRVDVLAAHRLSASVLEALDEEEGIGLEHLISFRTVSCQHVDDAQSMITVCRLDAGACNGNMRVPESSAISFVAGDIDDGLDVHSTFR